MRSRSVSALCVAAVLALAGARAVFAQYGHPPEAPGSTKITAQLVRTGLYKITGGGSNSLLRLSANGLILVDGKLAGNYEALLKQVRKIVDQPVRALVLTSDSEDRTGNNAKFLAAGTQIIAQRNLMHLTSPTVRYDRAYTLRLGGVEARLLHFGSAHTNGDTVVYFPNLRVVALGDLYGATPEPDLSAGGSLAGWSAALAQLLKLDFDIVAPSTGPLATRADLEAFKARIDKLVSREAATK